MRLSHQFTLGFASISFVVLVLALLVSFQAVKRSTLQAHVGKMTDLNSFIYAETQGDSLRFQANKFPYTTFATLDRPADFKEKAVRIQKEFDSTIQTEVTRIAVTSYFDHAVKPALVKSSTRYIHADSQYLTAILMVFAWVFVFLICISMVLSILFSIYLLNPFYKSLNIISNYRVDTSNLPAFEPTSTFEFQRLNAQLQRMMQRSNRDYLALKEFNENASHELQTPLAIMQAKLDLLFDSSLQEDQLRLVSEVKDQIKRLSSIKKALTMLIQLEHYELNLSEVAFSDLLKDTLAVYADILEFKQWDLRLTIDEEVKLTSDKELLLLVLNNLISNALKHGTGPYVSVELTVEKLVFTNPGLAPLSETSALIPRFQHHSSHLHSMGIGLSLIQKIADLHQYKFTYSFEKGVHNLTLHFFNT